MGHDVPTVPTAEEELPDWLHDVLCDLERAADDRGLADLSNRLHAVRAARRRAPCARERVDALSC